MIPSAVTVLKFGGSVLRDEGRLRIAVHEMYRWRREGHAVLGVVSAMAGRTDQLLGHARTAVPSSDAHAQAAIVAAGELESSALLGQHLARAGLPARVLGPEDIAFFAKGPALDADPQAVDVAALTRALTATGIVVFPGYVARDEAGRPAVLGRGGSDLTALFLADRLQANGCRLIKDVDGLYERDPALPGPPPRRYARATFDVAAALGGSVLQHKAVCFARQRGLTFEVGHYNATAPTVVGTPDTAFAAGRCRVPRRVGVLGLGTVGRGVVDLLQQIPEIAEVRAIAVRRPERHHDTDIPARLLTSDVLAVVAEDVDVIVEVIGGCDVAGVAVRAALRRGIAVVTANKALLAQCGAELQALADAHETQLCGSASVGGVMPVLEWVSRERSRRLVGVRAILNGTTNFVLDRCASGMAFEDSVAEAQRLGFAEVDPSRDLGGYDALDKLQVIAAAAGVAPIRVAAREALDADRIAATRGARCRHVATLSEDGAVAVRLEPVSADDPLASITGADNAAVLTWADGRGATLRGQGAGRWPTAEAVVADVLELARLTG